MMPAQPEITSALGQCSGCGNSTGTVLLAEAQWYPYWDKEDGACPGCVQENLLRTLLAKEDAALHEAIQTVWPLDAEAAFGVLPTRLRLHADLRFSGQGVTLALVDSGFYPHPDVVLRGGVGIDRGATPDDTDDEF
jgi:subtilisin family serine protease